MLTKKLIKLEGDLIKTCIVYGCPLMWFMGDPVTFHEIIRKIVSQVSFHSINLSLVHSGLVVKGSWAIQGNNSESKNPLGNSGLFVKGF